MKISTDVIEYIENVIKTGKSVNIDKVIIEPGMVRAIDDNRTVVMFQDEGVPDMPFGSIGLNRIDVLLARIELAKTQDKFSIDVVVDDGEEYARSMTMNATGSKVDYRCANVATINAPKQINDSLVYRIQLNAEAVSLLQKGQTAFGSESVTFMGDDDGISFNMTDISSDAFKHTFNDDVEMLNERTRSDFSHNYPLKTILALFKQNPDGYFEIGGKGILSIQVNGLNIYVLPQV